MNEPTFIPASERYRACEECRRQAQTFLNKTAQARMVQLAVSDYERRAVQVEAFEPKPAKTA